MAKTERSDFAARTADGRARLAFLAFFCAVCMALAVCFAPQSAFADEGQAQQDQAADVQQEAAAADNLSGPDQVEGVLPDQADDQAEEGEDADVSDPDQVAAVQDSDSDADSTNSAEDADEEDAADDSSNDAVQGVKETAVLDSKTTVADADGGLVDDDPLPSNTGQSDSMKYYHSSSGFDIQGIDGSGNAIQTTYANQGYRSAIKVNGTQYETGISQLGKVYTFDGVQVKLNITISPDGESVYYKYTLYNTNAATATIQLGNSTDVQIGDNDYAKVTISGGSTKISMINDRTSSSTYGMKYTLCADPDGAAFTGVWDGYYGSAYNNIFTTNSDGDLTGTDSGLAFHWDFSLASGEMATRTAVFNISPALKVTDVTLTADASTGKLNMTIPFTDAENRTQTLYYTLQDADQQTATTSTGEGVESGEFDVNTDVPASWTAGNTYTVTLYVKDSVGYTSKTYTYYVYWPGSDDPTKTYNTLSFENTSTAFANVRDVQGTVITLPTDPGTVDGKRFKEWNTEKEGTGATYAAGASYTIAADATLYAQWAYSVADAVISAIPDQTYDGTAKRPSMTVTINGTTLTEGTDYFVSYSGDNVNAGYANAYATVTGAGAYIGTATKTFNINRANLTDVSVSQTDSHTYDATAYSAAVNASATAKGDQEVSFVYYLDGTSADYGTAEVPSFTNAGTYTVNYRARANNHNDYFGTFQVVVAQKAATVTADNKAKIYGDDDPTFTAVTAGTLNGDTVAYTLSRAAGSNIGFYTITPSGEASQGNYAVTFVNGTLTVNPKAVTATADNKSKVYGSDDPEFTATAPGLVSGDTLTYSFTRDVGENVGSYTIYASGDALQGNYIVSYANGTLTIAQKAVNVKGVDKEKIYGDADPELTASVTGLEEGESVSYTLNRVAGENVGDYTITASGEASQGNFYVSFADGVLTINQKPVTVTADSKTKTYGDDDPELTATVEGLLGDDTVEYTLSRESGEDVGSYVIDVAGEASQGNYAVTFDDNYLQIDPRPVTVTADSKTKFYGEADPELTVTVEGTLNGDTIEYGIERDPGEDAGAYVIRVWSTAIAPMSDQAVQGNYDVTFVDGTFTIEPDPATWFEISAEGGDELVYNGSEQGPAFAVTCDGRELVEGTDYTVSGATATKIGSYAAAFTGIGNYAGTAELPWSIVAPSHENGESEGTEDDPENDKALDDTYESIMDEVSETGDVPTNVKETAEGAVKAAIAAGDSFITEVRAVQVTKQAESDVPASDKSLVAIAVQSLASDGQIAEMVEYLDISVLLKNARTDEILAYITQTDSPIYFAIQLDADIASQLAGKAVYLVRTHDGESTFIDAVLGEDGVLRFSSDLFSTYAIASVETVEPEPGNENGDGAQACAQAASCSDGFASPKTGDTMPAAPIAGIALAAFAALAAASRKRAER